MLEFTLYERLHKFIKEFRVVHKRHIFRFFRDENKVAISRNITQLALDGLIYDHDPMLSVAKKIPLSAHDCNDLFKAINVMCVLPSKEIKWFTLVDRPWELLFVSNEGVCFSVAVFNERDWPTTYAMAKRLRNRPLVPSVPDPVNYIAVIPSDNLIPKIKDLGFTYYALLDNNGHPTLLRDDGD